MITNLTLTIAAGVLAVLFNILMAVAVELDCRARNIKAKTAYSLLTFFFPIIVGIVYACTRKNAQKISNEPVYNSQKLAKRSVIVFIIAVIAIAAASGIEIYSVFSTVSDTIDDADETVYYDMKGNEYENLQDIILYDTDGNSYEYIIDEDTYDSSYINQTTGESYEYYNCYLTMDGYFYYDEDESIQINDDLSTYSDTDGTEYYSATGVYWDADGKIKTVLDDVFSRLSE